MVRTRRDLGEERITKQRGWDLVYFQWHCPFCNKPVSSANKGVVEAQAQRHLTQVHGTGTVVSNDIERKS